MKKEKFTLLVIDMQQVAFDGNITPPITHGSQLLDKVAILIEACRSANTPVIFAQTCAPSGRPYAKDMHGWEIHSQVAPCNGEHVVFKVGPSGFESPALEETLIELGTTELIICGIWTEGCVSITTKGALKRGYGVYLVADGHGTVRETGHDADAIIAVQNKMMMQRGAKVVEIKTLLSQLEEH